jgi:hypothetical protein
MKTLITLLTVTALIGSATVGMAADQQASDAATDKVARDVGGAHASAHVPTRVHTSAAQNQSAIDFQAQGSN